MTAYPRSDGAAPHSARVYDYWLGGKNNYEADAAAARHIAAIWPGVKLGALLNREFMHRATRWLVRKAGVRQFLDIGSGIPTEPNLHQVAQAEDPSCRVLYADNDPIVLQYARALLRGTPEGRTGYVHADVTRPQAVLESAELRKTIDLGEPVAVSFMALLHLVSDERGAARVVRDFMDAVPSGSYLFLSHATADFDPELMERVERFYSAAVTDGGQLRSRGEIMRFFDGLEMVEPGLVVPHRWHPQGGEAPPDVTDADVSCYGGVARKP